MLVVGAYLLIGQIVIARSSSRRERSEEALRASEKRFKALCEQAPLGIYSTDAQGLTVYTNPRWSQMSGLSATDRFLTVVLFSVLLCYAQFPFWPSEPPRVVFAGLDLPSYCTIFRRFNLWILGDYGIHTSVFPSAHVAGVLSTAFGFRLTMPEGKRIYRSLFAIALLIALATVYGRYHYLADAICGAVIACIVSVLALAPGSDASFPNR